ncbi:MAG: hypothetical protein GY710_03785 [Desulfobacteraceae bacterium]|nr:hypothetical protein [Desulfobacteraceae bacterium]
MKKQKPQTPEDKKIHKVELNKLGGALRKEISRVNRLENSDQLDKPQEKNKVADRGDTQKQDQKKPKFKITLDDPKYADLKKLREEYGLLKKQKPQTPEDKKIHKVELNKLGGALRKEISRVNRLENSDQLKKSHDNGKKTKVSLKKTRPLKSNTNERQ